MHKNLSIYSAKIFNYTIDTVIFLKLLGIEARAPVLRVSLTFYLRILLVSRRYYSYTVVLKFVGCYFYKDSLKKKPGQILIVLFRLN